MASTFIIDLEYRDWIKIDGGKSGFITNASDNTIRFFESDYKPLDNQGHRLHPGDIIHYYRNDRSDIWVYGTEPGGKVAVTPDD